jgi:phosphatidylglycerophosphate synthase
MASKFRVKYIFKPLVKILAKLMIKLHVTPNLATIIMLIMSLVSLFSIIFLRNLILFGIFVFLTGLYDGVDGMIARLTNQESSYGGFFDSTMDRFSEFFVLFGLLIYTWDQKLLILIDMKLVIILSIIGSLMISYSRARAEVLQEGDYDIGLMARSERLFFLFITMVLAYFIGFINYFLFIFMLLTWGTAIFRFFKIFNQLRDKKRP